MGLHTDCKVAISVAGMQSKGMSRAWESISTLFRYSFDGSLAAISCGRHSEDGLRSVQAHVRSRGSKHVSMACAGTHPLSLSDIPTDMVSTMHYSRVLTHMSLISITDADCQPPAYRSFDWTPDPTRLTLSKQLRPQRKRFQQPTLLSLRPPSFNPIR